MDMKDFRDYIMYGIEPSNPVEDQAPWWLAGGLQKMVVLQAVEEVESDLPLRRYTPANPPRKDWLSKLPIAVPIKPEFKRYDIDLNTYLNPIESDIEKMILRINTSKEKTGMQAKSVFDLYFKRAYETLDKVAEEKLDQLVEEDENIRLIKITIMELNSKLKDTPRNFPGILTPRSPAACTRSTRIRMEKWSKKETDARRRLDRMHEEVEALLLSCETYNQACVILRAYGIINNNGEMQEYKPF